MSTCVKKHPNGSVIGSTNSGLIVYGREDFMVEDPGCAAGLVVLTQAEVTALTTASPGSGAGSTPPAALMRETFFLSFGLVIGVWFVGKCVGAVLRLIRDEDREFS